ncbi:hypothetical protein ESCO_005396 [Escovopsis weberi]|uniref:Integral membrane protein n=1 Tax=Escovopsis weberi TaxID=150374 RepID=A0A0M9VV56_ESCWE|nr:hypothetical protein ESCO_005396 [Escovopsis weberi]
MMERQPPAAAFRPGARPLRLHHLPPALRPLVRAYLMGYFSAVAPRLLTLLLQIVSRRRNNTNKVLADNGNSHSVLESVARILRTGLELHRFPTFCAALVGGSTLLQMLWLPYAAPFHRLIDASAKNLDRAWRLRLARWLSTFIAGWLSLQLLQSKRSSKPLETKSETDLRRNPPAGFTPKIFAGRTLDLTLFAVTRALDVLVGEFWDQHRNRRQAARTWTWFEQFLAKTIDPIVFTVSLGLIMWSWFYSPERLPPSFNKWITSAASVDQRLIEALRRCRNGELVYGQETGQSPLLGSMCADYQLPHEWGDPTKCIPFPCDLAHMGSSPSCEIHAVHRFFQSWKWSMSTYLPLTLALQLRNPRRLDPVKAVASASRSSSFLAACITLFYYSICLCRSRIGPRLLGTDNAARQRIDGGLCVTAGCFACGWGALIETAGRRKDLAMFVAPRALATLLPRRYPVEQQWHERLVFAASTAVVFAFVLEKPKSARGVFGKILGAVLRS